MTNLYYGTVKQLLERISSVMVDRLEIAASITSAPTSALTSTPLSPPSQLYFQGGDPTAGQSSQGRTEWGRGVFTCFFHHYLPSTPTSTKVIEELGLNPDNAGERGLRLLFVLSFVFPSHFLYR